MNKDAREWKDESFRGGLYEGSRACAVLDATGMWEKADVQSTDVSHLTDIPASLHPTEV